MAFHIHDAYINNKKNCIIFFFKCPWTSVHRFVSDVVNVVFGYIKKMQLA